MKILRTMTTECKKVSFGSSPKINPMKSSLIISLFILFSQFSFAQDNILGIWKAIDDEDGEATSHIEVFEKDGKAFGKIVQILAGDSDALCEQCEGDKYNQPILGMEIIWDMKPKGDNWAGGRIMDPENGKTYKCKMQVKNGVLEVRGFIGIPALGRTQKWYRVN